MAKTPTTRTFLGFLILSFLFLPLRFFFFRLFSLVLEPFFFRSSCSSSHREELLVSFRVQKPFAFGFSSASPSSQQKVSINCIKSMQTLFCLCLVEPGEVEVHSDAEHDLSADDPTAADRQSEPSAECYQAASTNESSSIADAEHEPSVESLGSQHHVEPADEQLELAGHPPAPAWLAHAVGPNVRSHAEPDERKLERPISDGFHLFKSTACPSLKHGSKSIHAVEE